MKYPRISKITRMDIRIYPYPVDIRIFHIRSQPYHFYLCSVIEGLEKLKDKLNLNIGILKRMKNLSNNDNELMNMLDQI